MTAQTDTHVDDAASLHATITDLREALRLFANLAPEAPPPGIMPSAWFRAVATASVAIAASELAPLPDDVEQLADALTSCIVRLDDLGEGDGPTAQHARAALRRVGR